MSFVRRIILSTALLFAVLTPLRAQQQAAEDSLFWLVQADRAQQLVKYGMTYRLVQGNARFLHNDTYLLCDSASWNVDNHIIEAFGHVQVIQDNTMLRSEELIYIIDQNLAKFRGGLVELFDKEGNTLRTNQLEYNTKDSTAVFTGGGAMKDKDGNVIESRRGSYDAGLKTFTFEDQVELFMDTIKIKTNDLRYLTQEEKAYFGVNTYMWRDAGFLKADAGWYERGTQMAYFSNRVFMNNPDYEAWADELYFDQTTRDVDLYSNAQLLDTVNLMVCLGDHILYKPDTDSTFASGILTDNPAVVYYGENENHEVDTLYMRADSIFVYSVPMCGIDSVEKVNAAKRIEDIMFDAIGKKRADEAASREQENIEKMRKVGKLPPEWLELQQKAEADSLAALAAKAAADSLAALGQLPDSLSTVRDTLSLPDKESPPDSVDAARDSSFAAAADSLAAGSDAALALRDSTPVRHLRAFNNVRFYRSDLQGVCDSLVFTELDSVARLYNRPVLWNAVKNQLSAEEMLLLMKDGQVFRGSMVTDAWMISQEDSVHFNQIKSTEMLGYFHENQLYRFDALGGVSAVFYMAEDGAVTTINLKEAKMMTAAIKDGNAQRLLYMESIKSDAYPLGELVPEKQRLKDFEWRGEERPVDRNAITDRTIKPTEAHKYKGIHQPRYREVDNYFDNYMSELLMKLETERIQRQEEERLRREAEEQEALERQMAEEAAADSAGVDVPSLEIAPAADSIAAVSDSAYVAAVVEKLQAIAADSNQAVADSDEEGFVPAEVQEAVGTISREDLSLKQETAQKSLTRAERRAVRKAERQARREARRLARAERRAARRAAKQQ